jgi:hypothetical protein
MDSLLITLTGFVKPCQSSLRPPPTARSGLTYESLEAKKASSKLKCYGAYDSMMSLSAGFTVTNSK